MATTPDLGIPLVATQQAQPEVTHNEGIYLLQAVLNGVITQQNAPPGSPTAGDAYIVGTAPTGAWSGRANCVAIYTDGGWRFLPGNDSSGTPIAIGTRNKGLKVYRRDLDAEWVFIGTAWVEHTQTDGSI